MQTPALLGNTCLDLTFKTGKETMDTLAGELVTKKKIITSTLDQRQMYHAFVHWFIARDLCYKPFSEHR